MSTGRLLSWTSGNGWLRQRRDGTLTAARQPEHWVLAVMVGLALLLRLYFLHQWRPALLGYPDEGVYLLDAHFGPFYDPLRIGGYALFLQAFHAIRPHLSFAILIQHLMGIASGLLLFGAARRARLPGWVGLVPAAVVMLNGAELFLEHAVLTESVFILLMDLGLFAFVCAWRAIEGPGHRYISWSLLAGLCVGTSAIVKSVGLALLPMLVVAFLFVLTARRPWRRRLLATGAVVLVAAAPVTWYLVAHRQQTGFGDFTADGYFDLYGRVAPFADCRKFTPPKGTRRLCIAVPMSQRLGNAYWEFVSSSPAERMFGASEFGPPIKRTENSVLRRFSVAAVLGQPLDYLTFVGRDLVRIVDPTFPTSPYRAVGNSDFGNTPEGLLRYYFSTSNRRGIASALANEYPGDGFSHHDMAALRNYERATRVEGPLMAVMLVLAALSVVLGRGERFRVALFFAVATLGLFVLPIVTSEYDWRFVIPGLGPLAVCGGIGLWQTGSRLRPILRRRHEATAAGARRDVAAGQ